MSNIDKDRHEYIQKLLSELVKVRAEHDSALDEIRCLKFNLEQKSGEIGRSEHRGNTVDYIYDKLELYSKQMAIVVSERDRLQKEHAEMLEEIKQCYYGGAVGSGLMLEKLKSLIARVEAK